MRKRKGSLRDGSPFGSLRTEETMAAIPEQDCGEASLIGMEVETISIQSQVHVGLEWRWIGEFNLVEKNLA